MKLPHIERIGKLKEFAVYAVDGEHVRNNSFIDFVAGGNPERYPDFVPPGELWIEFTHVPRDAAPVILHEYIETKYMESGMTYGKAHEKACVFEEIARKSLQDKGTEVKDFKAALKLAREWVKLAQEKEIEE